MEGNVIISAGPASSYLFGEPANKPTPRTHRNKPNLKNAFVCFTGRFDMGLQRQCAALTKRNGGIACERVGGGLDFLVVGNKGSKTWVSENRGWKMIKAERLKEKSGKPATITENQFIEMVGK